MHLLRAQHCFFYGDNKSVALGHLARAEARLPPLDEAFSIYFLRKSAHVLFFFSSSPQIFVDLIQNFACRKSQLVVMSMWILLPTFSSKK
jgi:hypothetical protein